MENALFRLPRTLVCLCDAHGTVKRVGAGWTELLGHTPDDVEGHILFDFLEPTDGESFLSAWLRLGDGVNPTITFQARAINHDGSITALDWSAATEADGSVLLCAYPRSHESAPRREVKTPAHGFRYGYDQKARSLCFCESGVKDVLGYTPGEAVKLDSAHLKELIHPEDLPRAFGGNRGEEHPLEAEVRLRHRNGDWRWVQLRQSSLDDGRPEPSPDTWIGWAEDISSETVQAHKDLTLSEVPCPLWVIDSTTLAILEANAEAATLYGYTVEELRHLTVLDLMPKGKVAHHSSRQKNLPIRHVARDGHTVYIRYAERAAPHFGPNARLWAIHDVTELVASDQDLHRIQQELEAVSNHVPAAVFVVDEDCRVVLWNRQSEKLFGKSSPRAMGRHVRDVIRNGDRNLRDSLDRLAVGEQLEARPASVRRGGGRHADILLASAPLMAEGLVRWGTVVVVEDVTDSKQSARALQQLNADLEQRVLERTADLMAANEELEAFCRSISHDLRGPLRTIEGFTAAAIGDEDSVISAASKGHLQRVRRAGQRVNELIDALLSLARLSQTELRREWVDLSELAHQVATEFRLSDRSRSVKFEIQPNLSAYGDERLLRVLVENLIGNAWKFTSEEPNAVVRFGKDEGGYYVEDNGAGFDANMTDRLFRPFERLHSHTQFPGTGIGLASSQRIVARHSGTITASGEVGEGARFQFTLGADEGEAIPHLVESV